MFSNLKDKKRSVSVMALIMKFVQPFVVEPVTFYVADEYVMSLSTDDTLLEIIKFGCCTK